MSRDGTPLCLNSADRYLAEVLGGNVSSSLDLKYFTIATALTLLSLSLCASCTTFSFVSAYFSVESNDHVLFSRVDMVARVVKQGSAFIKTTTGMIEDAGVITEAITMGSMSLKCNHNVLSGKGLVAQERLDESKIPTYIEDICTDATVGSGSRGSTWSRLPSSPTPCP